MPELMRFTLDRDESVLVEVDADDPMISPVSRTGEVIESAALSFRASLTQVRSAAEAALGTFRDMDARPDEVSVEFGVKLNAQAGAVIAKTGVDGHLRIALTWRRGDTSATEPSPES